MTEPNKNHYGLVPDEPDADAARLHAERVERAVEAQSRAPTPIPASVDSIDEDADDTDDEESSLNAPISPQSDARTWIIAALCVIGVVVLAWLAGASGLVIPGDSADAASTDLSIMQRLGGVMRTISYAVLSTAGFTFGICCLAFVRQRPLGDVLSLFAKCALICAVGLLTWIVPCDFRVLKQLLNSVGPLAIACVLYMFLFRLPLKEAMLAVAYAVLGMALLVFFSYAVVFSMRF